MTVYGDLETSSLRELPQGRSPIATNVVRPRRSRNGWSGLGKRLREEVAKGTRPTCLSRIGEAGSEMPLPVRSWSRTG